MSIQVPITKTDYAAIRRAILSGQKIVCSTRETYVKWLLVGQRLAAEGKPVKAGNITLAEAAQ